MKISKDLVISVMRMIVGGSLLGYVVFLFTNNLQIAVENSQAYLVFLGILGAFIFFMGVKPLCIPRARLMQCFLGIFLILFGNYALKDDPSKLVFIADAVKILGVFLAIAGPLGVCVTSKCQKKVEESKVIEIIEV